MNNSTCSGTLNYVHHLWQTIGIGLLGHHVSDMHRLFGDEKTVKRAPSTDPKSGIDLPGGPFGRCAKDRDPAECAVLVEQQVAKLGSANADRVLQHSVEDRLKLARRTADDLQHFRRRRLLLQ